MSAKEEFIEIFREHVHRDGAEALLDYLTNKSDFFTSPASARYHGAYAGGLCEHSLNVYHCLTDYLARERVTDLYGLEYSPESIALVALLHDVCKIGCYKPSTRNVKGEDGKWTQVPTFTYEDPLPYGHGEKSVYVVNGFVRLTREEAMAIRWHMGFSGTEDSRLVGRAFAKYHLAFALSAPVVGRHSAVMFPPPAGRRSSARQSAALTVTTALSGGGRAQERKQFIL